MTCWWRSDRRTPFPGSSANRHRVRPVGHAGGRRSHDAVHAIRAFSSVATRRLDRRTSSGPSPRPPGSDLHPSDMPGCRVTDRLAPMVNLSSQKMGIHEWSYDNDISLDRRYAVPTRTSPGAEGHQGRGRTRLRRRLAFKEAERCLNCDVQTVFTARCASSAMPALISVRSIASR